MAEIASFSSTFLVALGFLNAVAWEYPWMAILVLWKSPLALLDVWILFSQPTSIYFVKVNNGETKTIYEICNAAMLQGKSQKCFVL